MKSKIKHTVGESLYNESRSTKTEYVSLTLHKRQKSILQKLRAGEQLFVPLGGVPYFSMKQTPPYIDYPLLIDIVFLRENKLVQYRDSDYVYLTELGRTIQL